MGNFPRLNMQLVFLALAQEAASFLIDIKADHFNISPGDRVKDSLCSISCQGLKLHCLAEAIRDGLLPIQAMYRK